MIRWLFSQWLLALTFDLPVEQYCAMIVAASVVLATLMLLAIEPWELSNEGTARLDGWCKVTFTVALGAAAWPYLLPLVTVYPLTIAALRLKHRMTD